MNYKVHKIKNPHTIEVSVPGSKSITNRALLIAALADGRSRLDGVLFSDDSRHFLNALMALGFPVDIDEENKSVEITGFGGRIPCVLAISERGHVDATVDVGSAGTAARFLAALLGLSKGRFRMVSSDQMKKRPMKELLEALESLGAQILFEEEPYHFPFIIESSGIKGEEITINVDKSSQFLSALLIVSVLMPEDFTIYVKGSHGMAYVEMTVKMMEQFGVSCFCNREKQISYQISRDCQYQPRNYQIEPDLSAACYFYAMSPVLHVPALVNGVHRDCLQGDIAFLEVLSDMGCKLEETETGIMIYPPKEQLKGGIWDLSSFSDQALTLAAIAPFADSQVQIRGISHIRLQESDRIAAILHNLKELGIHAEEEKEGILTIYPGKIHSGVMETYEDHRVAMSFSIPGLVCEGVEIVNPMCCRKTFETYFEVLEERVY